YRARWDLPQDYPMVAPSYAEKRSALAKQIGLGRKPSERTGEDEATVEPEMPVVQHLPERRRGRKKA
ncbi:MucR family transcriptional regulator, partial [Dorea longicatena]|uniref:MucR family transcriptional regulator n=1 Tax=Dorea longicatena TaxID=88431 RepID=UPI0029CA63D3